MLLSLPSGRHWATTCLAAAQCVVCAVTNKPAGHRVGSKARSGPAGKKKKKGSNIKRQYYFISYITSTLRTNFKYRD